MKKASALDILADPQDVKGLIPKLKNLVGNYEYPNFNHLGKIRQSKRKWNKNETKTVFQISFGVWTPPKKSTNQLLKWSKLISRPINAKCNSFLNKTMNKDIDALVSAFVINKTSCWLCLIFKHFFNLLYLFLDYAVAFYSFQFYSFFSTFHKINRVVF